MSDAVYAATRKGLFRVARTASGWGIDSVSFLGDSVSLVCPDARSGALYAALELGHFGVKLHKSLDRGKTWRACGKPTYPPKPDDIEDKNDAGQVIPWNVERIWALTPGHESQPGVLWCGTIPGGLFRSSDGGETWALNRALWHHPKRKSWFGGGADYPGIHSIVVHPERPDELLVAVSCGGVWRSTDGGASFRSSARGMVADYMPPERAGEESAQDPHCMVQCRGAPHVLWVQHHSGIFRSTNGGESWQRIHGEPTSFGFAVCVHPRDPDRAWFVPATKDEQRVPLDGKVVVSRTLDGGRSFQVSSHGLPQEHAYDITFRHGLDIDASGERLAFGSTTGSLWISEDQGERWQHVSAHLPPIYAVRFA